MSFNGEVLVGRGESFAIALRQFWNWEEEVLEDQVLRDGWRAIHVRTPADDDELTELARRAAGPVLACLVVESDVGRIRGVSAVGHWEAALNDAAVSDVERRKAAAAAERWAEASGLRVGRARIDGVFAAQWRPFVEAGFFTLLDVLGIAERA